MSPPHETIPVQVWADVDAGIASVVKYLNSVDGVRTIASCQGTIGEGGPNPYRAQVMATWTDEAFQKIKEEFDFSILGKNWGYIHPRSTSSANG